GRGGRVFLNRRDHVGFGLVIDLDALLEIALSDRIDGEGAAEALAGAFALTFDVSGTFEGGAGHGSLGFELKVGHGGRTDESSRESGEEYIANRHIEPPLNVYGLTAHSLDVGGISNRADSGLITGRIRLRRTFAPIAYQGFCRRGCFYCNVSDGGAA